ncbi:response regulator transcription factor [Phocaeicola coprocola]|uniref:response regulator transcription factor n=1 Tax=Phocaeicola coprocola TaxID=310298 RepID=UPI002FD81490
MLILIGRGKSSKEIAEELSLSIHTVSRHRQNILQKLQVSNSAQAFGIARELHLL